MDLRELRSKVKELVDDAETLSAEIFVQSSNGLGLISVHDLYIDEEGNIIIETE